jgi:hypothetical protein
VAVSRPLASSFSFHFINSIVNSDSIPDPT